MPVSQSNLPIIQRNALLQQQQALAKQYEENQPRIINEQYEAAKAPVARQYDQARSNLISSLNKGGMLHSGKAITSKAQLEADRYGAYANARQNAVQNSNDQLLALQTDPLQAYANINDQNTSYQQQLRDIENQRNQLSQQLLNQQLGYLGRGIGSGAANLNAGYGFFYNPAAKP